MVGYGCYMIIYLRCGEIGGLKLWEGSLDLIKVLQSEVQKGQLSFTGKRVLEVRS